jgi:hypothetical protein
MNPTLPNHAVPKNEKLELENKIKALHNFRTALRSGTFSGGVAHHIGALGNLLDNEHDAAVKEYESQLAVHPEWGIPKDLKVGANA